MVHTYIEAQGRGDFPTTEQGRLWILMKKATSSLKTPRKEPPDFSPGGMLFVYDG